MEGRHRGPTTGRYGAFELKLTSVQDAAPRKALVDARCLAGLSRPARTGAESRPKGITLFGVAGPEGFRQAEDFGEAS